MPEGTGMAATVLHSKLSALEMHAGSTSKITHACLCCLPNQTHAFNMFSEGEGTAATTLHSKQAEQLHHAQQP